MKFKNISKVLFLSLLVNVLTDPAEASARLSVDKDNKVLTVTSKLYFYGSEASEGIALLATEEIDRMWNSLSEEVYSFPRTQDQWKVEFKVDWELIPTDEANSRILLEKDCRNNFVRVENTSGEMTEETRSSWIGANPFMPWRFGNTGFFNMRDEIGYSTTVVHEYGHALGLDHSAPKVAGQPGIMSARGTWVNPEFQVNPAAAQGTPGGTIDVKKRVVLRSDIEKILKNVVDINLVGEPLPDGPLLGTPIDPNCLGEPMRYFHDERGMAHHLIP